MIELIIWVRKFFGGTSKDAMGIFNKTLTKLEKVESGIKAEAKRIEEATTKANTVAVDALVEAESKYLEAKAKASEVEVKVITRLNSLANTGKKELEENQQFIKNIKAVIG